MWKGLICFILAATVTAASAASARADRPVKDARYRVRHGGKVALQFFERKATFEGFNSRKAKRLEPNLAWADDRGRLRSTSRSLAVVAFC
jgi:hypothetical protein